jgi:hypothetical protein
VSNNFSQRASNFEQSAARERANCLTDVDS